MRGQADAPHGYVRYTHGCRCDECKAAKREYIRERRRVARELAAKHTTKLRGRRGKAGQFPAGTERHFVPDVKHGTSYAWFERGCRCLDCTAWKSAGDMARRMSSASP